MRRVTAPPRANWRYEVEELGFTYHTIDGDLYWDEAGWYEFSLAEIEEIEAATNTLHALCLQAVQVVLDQDRLDEFGIPSEFHAWIRDSWDNDEPTVYGRFDLAWDGRSAPKLLEYNADTPTALFEAAVVQWHWLQSVHPGLLPTAWQPLSGDYVRKPILSREGSNIQVVRRGMVERETHGPYSKQPMIYQAFHPLMNLGGHYAVLGSWIVGDAACGLGIREDINPVTHDSSRFIPHLIRN